MALHSWFAIVLTDVSWRWLRGERRWFGLIFFTGQWSNDEWWWLGVVFQWLRMDQHSMSISGNPVDDHPEIIDGQVPDSVGVPGSFHRYSPLYPRIYRTTILLVRKEVHGVNLPIGLCKPRFARVKNWYWGNKEREGEKEKIYIEKDRQRERHRGRGTGRENFSYHFSCSSELIFTPRSSCANLRKRGSFLSRKSWQSPGFHGNKSIWIIFRYDSASSTILHRRIYICFCCDFMVCPCLLTIHLTSELVTIITQHLSTISWFLKIKVPPSHPLLTIYRNIPTIFEVPPILRILHMIPSSFVQPSFGDQPSFAIPNPSSYLVPGNPQ